MIREIPAQHHGDISQPESAPRGLSWRPFRAGVDIHPVFDEGDNGPAAAFLRYQPGASVPPHVHNGYEHILVLAGSQQDERGRYETGDVVMNPPGSSHSVRSGEGCIVFVLWERPVTFLEP